MNSRDAEKGKLVQQYLEADEVVLIHMDPRPANVVVPDHFKAAPVLRLNVAGHYVVPDTVIRLDEVGIHMRLMFGDHAFPCSIPWGAVYAITIPSIDQGMLFPEDMPYEVGYRYAQDLKLVAPDLPDPTRAHETTPAPAEDAPPRRHLRLVREGDVR